MLTALVLGAASGIGTSNVATATPAVGSGSGARAQAFAAAAQEFGVPTSVLEPVSYAQTRWEGHAGQHNTNGGYGPMNLVDATLLTADVARQRGGVASTTSVPSSLDTLGRAAGMLGISRAALRTDTAANIRGGAADFADAAYDVLTSGATRTTAEGQALSLRAAHLPAAGPARPTGSEHGEAGPQPRVPAQHHLHLGARAVREVRPGELGVRQPRLGLP